MHSGKKFGLLKASAVLLLISAVLLVVKNTAFRLQNVWVDGLTERTPETIISLTGLFRNQDLFSLEEKTVANAFANDTTLVFRGMHKVYPDTLYLFVEERKPAAAMRWLGVTYIMDRNGVVLSDRVNAASASLPLVTGLKVTSVSVGSQIHLRSARQMEGYCSVMEELEKQKCSDMVSSVNFGEGDSIYLVTSDGISVRLGDARYMRAKIGAVRTDTAYLRQLGKTGGLLDVTIPEDAKYLPEE